MVWYLTSLTIANEGVMLREIAPGISLGRDIIVYMGFTPIIPDNLVRMDKALFYKD
jgi:acyl CoA:acetate/3-ketoacid CoA transferase